MHSFTKTSIRTRPVFQLLAIAAFPARATANVVERSVTKMPELLVPVNPALKANSPLPFTDTLVKDR